MNPAAPAAGVVVGAAAGAGPLGWIVLAAVAAVLSLGVAAAALVDRAEVAKKNEELRKQNEAAQRVLAEVAAAEERALRFTRILVSAGLADSRVLNRKETDFVRYNIFGYSEKLARETFREKLAAVLDEEVGFKAAVDDWYALGGELRGAEHQIMCRGWMAELMSADEPEGVGMTVKEAEWLQEFDRRTSGLAAEVA